MSSTKEKLRLALLEITIDDGLPVFVKTGLALKRIREHDYESFSQICIDSGKSAVEIDHFIEIAERIYGL